MNAPVVLISGGVGLTPLMSMLHSLIEQNHAHPITWLHGCRNESVHAFKDQLTAIVTDNPQVRQHVFYNQLTGQERESGILEGHLDINKVPELDLVTDAHYFICGPQHLFRNNTMTSLLPG